MKWLAQILVNSLVLIVVAGYFNSFYLDGIGAAIVASLLISILNIFVKPILIVLTLPFTVITFGLFLFVINAVTLMIADGIMGSAFEIESFGVAILAAIVIAVLNVLIQKVIVEPLNKDEK